MPWTCQMNNTYMQCVTWHDWSKHYTNIWSLVGVGISNSVMTKNALGGRDLMIITLDETSEASNCDRMWPSLSPHPFWAWFHPFGHFWFAQGMGRLWNVSIATLIVCYILVPSKTGPFIQRPCRYKFTFLWRATVDCSLFGLCRTTASCLRCIR